MANKKENSSNLRLAGFFLMLVLGLIAVSIIFKVILVIKDSKFDGVHKINISFVSKDYSSIVSFSPQGKSFSMLKLGKEESNKDLSKSLEIPLDGEIKTKSETSEKNISSTLFKSLLPFGNSFKGITVVDVLRVLLFTRSVNQNSIYVRELSDNLNSAQKSTLISLTFTDPQIYQESQSVEVVNATNVFGLGTRLASLITNTGGNVILVSSPNNTNNKSRIMYSGDKTYTINKLQKFLDFPLEKVDQKGIADIIIIIGTDKLSEINF